VTALIQRTINLLPRDLEIIEFAQQRSTDDHPIERFIADGIRLTLSEWAAFEEECWKCWKLFEQWHYQPQTYPDNAIVYVSGFSNDAECLLLHPYSSRKAEFDRNPGKWIKTYTLQEIHNQLSPYLQDEMEELGEKWLTGVATALGVAA
jgi:hypothetical protein